MDPRDAVTTRRLNVLRAAVSALPLEDAQPDVARVTATLQALNPALSGRECGPAAWVFGTSMPSREWLLRPSELRRALLSQPAEMELPDQGLVQATAMDPELGARMIARRRFHRFLRRHRVLEQVDSGVGTGQGTAYRYVDHVFPDGRWGRIRGPAGVDVPLAPPSPEQVEAWFRQPFDELVASRPGTACRTVIGPLWRPAGADSEEDLGLVMTIERADGVARHVAVPAHLCHRARAEASGTVHRFSLPASAR